MSEIIENKTDGQVETRKYKLAQRKPGGTAGKDSIAYALHLPTKWLRKMGVTPEDREVVLKFDGTEISIKKADSGTDASAPEQNVLEQLKREYGERNG